jgi:hypothetical protein
MAQAPARSVLCAMIAILAACRAVAAQEPSLDDVLKRAAAYVARFQQQLSGIVAEETYDQDVRKSSSPSGSFVPHRRLRSDLLLVRPVGADRYVEFRDVFQVDGHAVRDRQERLSRLFLEPPPGAASQLERVQHESSRYNLGNVTRNMNTPVLALGFLHRDFQSSFAFKRTSDSKPELWVIEFEEKEKPTLIRTPGGIDLPSRGRFWIDPSTGAVQKTELIVIEGDLVATVLVEYGSQPSIEFLVPVEMRELYVSRRDRIDGRAVYGHFRRFQVQVDEAIKPVKQ